MLNQGSCVTTKGFTCMRAVGLSKILQPLPSVRPVYRMDRLESPLLGLLRLLQLKTVAGIL